MMSGSAQEAPRFWRQQYVIAAVGVAATVVLATVAVVNAMGGQSSPERTGMRTTVADELLTTPNSTEPSSPTTAAAAVDGTVALGRDLLPTTSEACHTPGFAGGSGWRLGTVQLASRRYESSYSCSLLAAGTGSLDFVLGKSYRQLHVTVGFADDAVALHHRVRFEIVGDGATYLAEPRVLGFGETAELTVDVNGVSRLALRITELSSPGGNDAPSKPVWASPTVIPVL